jgi:hypothetical protein
MTGPPKRHNFMLWDIPELRYDCLATTLPTRVYAGGAMTDSEHTLFIWRTGSPSKARGMVLGFYVDDSRLACLWSRPAHYADLFLTHGIRAVTEPDFSLWSDAPLVEQLWNTYRTRWLGRYWQDHGIAVLPSLSWAAERSFEFCFSGIPMGAPIVAVECRTPGGCDADRRAFLAGLSEGVKQTKPQSVLIYGGKEHDYWLHDRLPEGPRYHLINSWTTERRRERARQEREVREHNQLQLFGGKKWAEEEVVAAA